MVQTATLKSPSERSKRSVQQEKQWERLIDELNQAENRINASLDNINRQMEAIVEDMRIARQQRDAGSQP